MTSSDFLNIDLDLESNDDLSDIVLEFGSVGSIMRNEKENGTHKVSVELACLGNPQSLLGEYLTLIRKLSPRARKQWSSCTRRIFDIGFQGGSEPLSIHEELPASLLKQVAEVGAGIVITIYAVQQSGS